MLNTVDIAIIKLIVPIHLNLSKTRIIHRSFRKITQIQTTDNEYLFLQL